MINVMRCMITKYRKLKYVLMFIFFFIGTYAQEVAVKTNLLYGAYTLTPNLGLEISIGKQGTLDFGGGYNPWNREGSYSNNKKRTHWLAQTEYRHWFCRTFMGHFIGVHVLGTQYNISEHNLPLLFGKGSKNYRYEGYGVGGGVSYGYQFFLNARWNVEASLGVGYGRLHYDRYQCSKCGSLLGKEKRNYWGPTKASISVSYIIK